MDIQTCPQCRTSVVVKSDGRCPSCQASITLPDRISPSDPAAENPMDHGVAADAFFADEPLRDGAFRDESIPPLFGSAPGGSVGFKPATDVDNPYRSPLPPVVTPHPPAGAMYRDLPRRTIWWLLFSFQGRIPRRAYWGVSITNVVVFYSGLLFSTVALGDEELVVISDLFVFVAIVPMLWINLAVTAKRWHDRGKSAWHLLVVLIPYIGSLWQFIEVGCMRGTVGPNVFGPDPTSSPVLGGPNQKAPWATR